MPVPMPPAVLRVDIARTCPAMTPQGYEGANFYAADVVVRCRRGHS